MTGPQRRGDPYAGIPGRRLFVALELPDEAAAGIAAIVDAVRSRPLPTGDRDVRWVRMDGLHLTLRFLGPTPEARIEPTRAAVAAGASRATAVEAELGGVGTFPAGPRPRTIWIGMPVGGEAAAAVGATIEEHLVAAGWPPEPRAFRAHLTLARSDGLRAGPIVAGRLAEAVGDRRFAARLDTVALFESVTGGGPARYVAIDRMALG